jgi:hypothetical protein
MRKLALVVSIVTLVVPATASAKRADAGPKNAAKHCKALRAEMGAEAFRAAFGGKQGKKALGRCVSAQRKARRDARRKARRACRAKGLRGRALKRCFRQELAAVPTPQPVDYGHALEECRAQQADEPEGFAEEFGTGPDAIAKCVAHEVADDETAAEPEDEAGEDTEDADEPDSEEPGDGDSGEPDSEEL